MDDNQLLFAEDGPGRKGCFLTRTKGIILLLLLILFIVGVVLVVYFTSSKGDTNCNYSHPGNISESTLPENTSNTSDLEKHSQRLQIQFCNSLAEETNMSFGNQACKDVHKPTQTTATMTATATTIITTTAATTTTATTSMRIPTKLYPLHYNIELKPHLYSGSPKDFKFDGHVEIFLTCEEPTDKLYLHTDNLDVDNSTITFLAVDNSDTPQGWSHWTHDEARQFFILHLTSSVTVGKQYVFKMSYTAPLLENRLGFYLASYTVNNQTRWLATSQLEATDARRVFPCLDEPALKATFNVTLIRKANMTAISNMAIYSTTQRNNGWIADQFSKTLKMSTYLLAFVVCDFTFKEANTTRGTKYRVWAHADAVAAGQVDYALDIGVKILTYFEDYFNIPYPLPKEDNLAIRDSDFTYAGMENWGLIVFGEKVLLNDPREPTIHRMEGIARTVSHELAHQWFGDLVTPDWWDDIWLNEGFAEYFEYLGVDHVHPEWKMMDRFVRSQTQTVFTIDSYASSHPIVRPANKPDEIDLMFDSITYYKGAAVIRMMESFLGRLTFQQGLTNYLKENAYGNTNHTDLWRALGNQAKAEGSQIDLSEVMDTWVLQMGYPVVTVNINRQSRTAQVTQKHFLINDSTEPKDSSFGYKWMVPFTYTTDTEDRWSNPELVWMEKSDVSLTNLPENIKWIIGNIGQFGYYRMNYDEETWQNIIQLLLINHQVIPVKNRAQLIDDVFTLGRYGVTDQLLAIQLIGYMKSEMEYLPWSSAIHNLYYMDAMLSKTGSYGAFMMFMSDQVKPVYDQIGGWSTNSSDSPLIRKLRPILIDVLCKYRNKECWSAASARYRRWMDDPDGDGKVEHDLRSLVYCYGIKNGGYSEWQFAFERYKQESDASEKDLLLKSLTCTEEPWILYKLFDLVMNSSQTAQVLSSASTNPVGSCLAWDFFRNNLRKLTMEKIGGVTTILNSVISYFNTEYACQQIQDLMSIDADGSGNVLHDYALETCKTNVKWMERNLEKITKWLEER